MVYWGCWVVVIGVSFSFVKRHVLYKAKLGQEATGIEGLAERMMTFDMPWVCGVF